MPDASVRKPRDLTLIMAPLIAAIGLGVVVAFYMSFGYLIAAGAHQDRQGQYRAALTVMRSYTAADRADMSPATVKQRKQAAAAYIVNGFNENVDLTLADRKQIVTTSERGTPVSFPLEDFRDTPEGKRLYPWDKPVKWLTPIGIAIVVYVAAFMRFRKLSREE